MHGPRYLPEPAPGFAAVWAILTTRAPAARSSDQQHLALDRQPQPPLPKPNHASPLALPCLALPTAPTSST